MHENRCMSAVMYYLRSLHYCTNAPMHYENYSFLLYLLISNELLTTDTDEKAMAAPAMTGLSRNPVNGYSTPAAMGIPREL